MTLTKEKNNTHKQRTSPNDERPFKGQSGMKRRFDGYPRKPKNDIIIIVVVVVVVVAILSLLLFVSHVLQSVTRP